jgi:hypothetical protein
MVVQLNRLAQYLEATQDEQTWGGTSRVSGACVRVDDEVFRPHLSPQWKDKFIPNLKDDTGIRFVGLRKTAYHLSSNSRSLNWNLNPGHPEYEAAVVGNRRNGAQPAALGPCTCLSFSKQFAVRWLAH